MARSNTHIPHIICLAVIMMASVVHAQANRPLNVSSDARNTTTDNSSQAASREEMVRRAQEMAQQAEAAQRRAVTPTRSESAAALPLQNRNQPTADSPSATQSGDQEALALPGPGADAAKVANDAAAMAAAPPVVPLDPNESKPLGPSSAGQLGENGLQASGSGWGMTKTILALAFVVVLILVGRQLMLRWMGRPATVNKSRAVEVLSRVSVGPRQHVVLLRMGDRILVVADSAGQMRPLANIDEPEEVASILKNVTTSRPSSISQGFGQMLGKFDQEYDEQDDQLRISEEGQDTAEFQVDKARDQLNGLLARVRSMAGKGGA